MKNMNFAITMILIIKLSGIKTNKQKPNITNQNKNKQTNQKKKKRKKKRKNETSLLTFSKT